MDANEYIFKRSLAALVYSVFESEIGPAKIQAFERSFDDEEFIQSTLYTHFQAGIDRLMQEARSLCEVAYAKEVDRHNAISYDIFSEGGDAS